MPDRYLRSGLLRSDKFHALDADAQNLFTRLLIVVDDYGCFDGRPQIIANACFPLGRTAPLPLDDLYKGSFLVRYQNGPRNYIAITQWSESLRGWRKFPAPPVFTDRDGVKYRGAYGKVMNWANPRGTDVISVLLDATGRPVAPQPSEWRRIFTDFMPISVCGNDSALPVTEGVRLVTEGGRSVTERVLPVSNARPFVPSSSSSPSKPSTLSEPPPEGVLSVTERAHVPAPAPTPAGNGKVQLDDNGAWAGVDDAQRARWQEMFSEMSVPDQIERAGAWLVAHPEERTLYTERGELEQYLIRWMLNEARQIAERMARAKASTDSQGKR